MLRARAVPCRSALSRMADRFLADGDNCTRKILPNVAMAPAPRCMHERPGSVLVDSFDAVGVPIRVQAIRADRRAVRHTYSRSRVQENRGWCTVHARCEEGARHRRRFNHAPRTRPGLPVHRPVSTAREMDSAARPIEARCSSKHFGHPVPSRRHDSRWPQRGRPQLPRFLSRSRRWARRSAIFCSSPRATGR